MYILTTSNKNKISEFKAILGDKISIKKGKDIKEVNGSIDEVIIYKSKDSGVNTIVEDTILEVDGKEVVDIRYCIEKYSKATVKANWIVSLAINTGTEIKVYRGNIQGKLIKSDFIPNDSFGFDSYFVPKGTTKTLYELNKIGKKDNYSARKIALLNLLDDIPIFIKQLSNIPKWTGTYQGEDTNSKKYPEIPKYIKANFKVVEHLWEIFEEPISKIKIDENKSLLEQYEELEKYYSNKDYLFLYHIGWTFLSFNDRIKYDSLSLKEKKMLDYFHKERKLDMKPHISGLYLKLGETVKYFLKKGKHGK